MEETTWLERLQLEEQELRIKCDKLANALREDKIPYDQREILSRQFTHMKAYLNILVKRLNTI